MTKTENLSASRAYIYDAGLLKILEDIGGSAPTWYLEKRSGRTRMSIARELRHLQREGRVLRTTVIQQPFWAITPNRRKESKV